VPMELLQLETWLGVWIEVEATADPWPMQPVPACANHHITRLDGEGTAERECQRRATTKFPCSGAAGQEREHWVADVESEQRGPPPKWRGNGSTMESKVPEVSSINNGIMCWCKRKRQSWERLKPPTGWQHRPPSAGQRGESQMASDARRRW